MMTPARGTNWHRAALLLVCAALAGGCLAKKPLQKRRYLLSAPEVSAPGTAPLQGTLKVTRVRVSPIYDSKGFVYRTGHRRHETEFYHEFYSSPSVMFEELLVDFLRDAGTARVVHPPEDAGPADWRLSVRVDALYVDVSDRQAPKSVIALSVELHGDRGLGDAPLMVKRYDEASAIGGTGSVDVLEGWEAGLATILVALDADVRRAATAAIRTREAP